MAVGRLEYPGSRPDSPSSTIRGPRAKPGLRFSHTEGRAGGPALASRAQIRTWIQVKTAQAQLLAPRSARGAPSFSCTIKGNVNRKGQRIYHLPGTTAYAHTRMNKGLGERWFCSEDEARAAGWRKAGH